MAPFTQTLGRSAAEAQIVRSSSHADGRTLQVDIFQLLQLLDKTPSIEKCRL
jgi:hypothetical protein